MLVFTIHSYRYIFRPCYINTYLFLIKFDFVIKNSSLFFMFFATRIRSGETKRKWIWIYDTVTINLSPISPKKGRLSGGPDIRYNPNLNCPIRVPVVVE